MKIASVVPAEAGTSQPRRGGKGVVMLSAAETSLGERSRDKAPRSPQNSPHRTAAATPFSSPTRPDKALGRSCGGRNLAAWGWGGPCHAERSRRRSRSISRVRASPIRTSPERFPSAGSGQALGSARNDNPPKASPSSILNSYASPTSSTATACCRSGSRQRPSVRWVRALAAARPEQ